jgi:hypothetical protein
VLIDLHEAQLDSVSFNVDTGFVQASSLVCSEADVNVRSGSIEMSTEQSVRVEVNTNFEKLCAAGPSLTQKSGLTEILGYYDEDPLTTVYELHNQTEDGFITCPSVGGEAASCCDSDGSCTDGSDDWCCNGVFHCSNNGMWYAVEKGGISCSSAVFTSSLTNKVAAAQSWRLRSRPATLVNGTYEYGLPGTADISVNIPPTGKSKFDVHDSLAQFEERLALDTAATSALVESLNDPLVDYVRLDRLGTATGE